MIEKWQCDYCGEQLAEAEVLLYAEGFCHISWDEISPGISEPQPCGPVNKLENSMLEIILLEHKDLSPDEQDGFDSEDYILFMKVVYNGEVISLQRDYIEPEDCSFTRDLSWIPDLVDKCYEIGKAEGRAEGRSNGKIEL